MSLHLHQTNPFNIIIGGTTTLAFIALATAGCSDPLVGEWESPEAVACGNRSTLTFEGELNGVGAIEVNGDGGCFSCEFEVFVEPRGDGAYDGEIDFGDCTCGDRSSFDFEIALAPRADELKADIDNECHREPIVFTRIGGAPALALPSTGLTCEDGVFLYDGVEYTSCDQCPDADCHFEGSASQTCVNGECTVTSGNETAVCGDASATIVFGDGEPRCQGE